jgi:DNA-binding response OmpR family regulator
MSRILVVDDELALLQLLRTYLGRQGHEVICCATGSSGLAELDRPENHFDIAVLDHWLPDMSGMDLLTGVLSRRKDLKVLVSTGSFMDLDGIQIPDGRPVAFLQKPYLPKMLGEAIDNLLQSETGTAP